ERKPKKGQNRIKTGQKREAWRSREKSKAVTVNRGIKTEEDTKRRAGNANTIKLYRKKEERGAVLQFDERYKKMVNSANDYTSAITPDEPVLSTDEPDNSLSMGDEHLDTIPETKSDEFIKSSVENLIPIPSESKGIPEHKCDVPFHDNSPPLDVSKDQFEDLSESNDEFSSTDDDSFSFDKIDYVEASPPDSELVSSEVMEIVIPKVGVFSRFYKDKRAYATLF
nr:hypothetical protein [Tanacetum cinerariifolium]